MKKGYKRLLFFQIIIFLILLLNSFISSILVKYGIVLFLGLLILLFKYFFGTEKDNHRFTKDALFEILITLLIFFILYYASGILFKFVKTDNFYTVYGFTLFIIPIVLTIILKEYLRYNMLRKAEGSKLLLITTCILFTFIDITNYMSVNNFSSAYNLFMFLAVTFIPAVSNNIACTYICKKAGYKPNIVWLLVMRLYYYLIPIIPNPSEYIASLIDVIVPLIIAYKVHSLMKGNVIVGKSEPMNKKDYILIGVASLFLIAVVYFTSGYFKYYALSIGSGSMLPSIKIGDVVIIEKLENKNVLEVGDVVAFSYHGVTVVHRIVNIVDAKAERYYYTKGDDNENVDNYIVYEDMIVGVVRMKIPYLGKPAVWLNNL